MGMQRFSCDLPASKLSKLRSPSADSSRDHLVPAKEELSRQSETRPLELLIGKGRYLEHPHQTLLGSVFFCSGRCFTIGGVLRLPGNAHHPSVDLRFILPWSTYSSCLNWVMLAGDVTLSPVEGRRWIVGTLGPSACYLHWQGLWCDRVETELLMSTGNYTPGSIYGSTSADVMRLRAKLQTFRPLA